MRLNTRRPLLKLEATQDAFTESLSAAVFIGDSLWIASDELNIIERLSTDDGLIFQGHKSFPLDALIKLPATGNGLDQEIDIEGMDFRDSCLWLVGSHSLKRKNVKGDDVGEDTKLIKKLSKVEAEGNRFILARIPLVANDGDGEMELPSPAENMSGSGQSPRASQLLGDLKNNALTDALRQAEGGAGDAHLAKFLDLPGKDNGLDIEGLAVAGDKVFLGLRGPVLRGWAVILELSVETKDPARLTLKSFGSSGRLYRKHFLDMAGLGVRELCLDGDDLLVLAGPTMNLDGPSTLYRWRGATAAAEETLVRGERLERVLEIPFGAGNDHAEGIAIVPGTEQPRQLLVVYDNPGGDRKAGPGEVRADVFELPAA
ncbi:MAG: hypothetical protein QOF02_2442 [Blastocatellia bacterium]|jgi:hypothetical protein|nr:hypothetical protein [Blastocatellia bacterium]